MSEMFHPMGIARREIFVVCIVTSLVSCDPVNTRLDSSPPPQIYAYPNGVRPGIRLFSEPNGRTGVTFINTFAGETITQQWKPTDPSRSLLFSQTAASCRSQIFNGFKADRPMQEGAASVWPDYDMGPPFIQCMESKGLMGEQTELGLPSSFMFGVRHQQLAARYEAKKKGTTFAQFKSDVDSCGKSILTGERSTVREYTFEPTWTGHAGIAFGSTYRNIAPAGSWLKRCMEELGYAVEDRSVHHSSFTPEPIRILPEWYPPIQATVK